MKAKRAEAILSNQTAVAKRVYEATPAGECWDTQQIYSEYCRVNGPNTNRNVVVGCLRDLTKQKIVREPKPGMFMRCNVHQLHTQPEEAEPMSAEEELPVQIPDALDLLAAVSAKARNLQTQLGELVSMIDEAAVEIDDKLKERDAASEKLDALRAAIKEL